MQVQPRSMVRPSGRYWIVCRVLFEMLSVLLCLVEVLIEKADFQLPLRDLHSQIFLVSIPGLEHITKEALHNGMNFDHISDRVAPVNWEGSILATFREWIWSTEESLLVRCAFRLSSPVPIHYAGTHPRVTSARLGHNRSRCPTWYFGQVPAQVEHWT